MDELGVVGFIQSSLNKSVKQAANSSTEQFLPYYSIDASLTKISNLSETNCMGKIVPKVVLSNLGPTTLTSVDINFRVNAESTQTYNWSGNLDYTHSLEIELPEINFTVSPVNEVVVFLSNPNGTVDEFHQNDTITKAFNAAVVTPNEVKLMLKLDNNPQETTWDIVNSNGTILFSGGPYTQAGALIQETFQFTESDCHIFTIYDVGGNGLAVPGFFALFYNGSNQIILGTNFGSKATAQFDVDATVGFEELSKPVEISVYPNPVVNQGFISFTLLENNPVTIEIFNSVGQLVSKNEKGMMNPGMYDFELEAKGLNKGVYFVKVNIGADQVTKKFTIIN
jgi:hypothetical protein